MGESKHRRTATDERTFHRKGATRCPSDGFGQFPYKAAFRCDAPDDVTSV